MPQPPPPGTLTLPAKKLFEIVNALPDTDIRIEEDKGGKSVTVGGNGKLQASVIPNGFEGAADLPLPALVWWLVPAYAESRRGEIGRAHV